MGGFTRAASVEETLLIERIEQVERVQGCEELGLQAAEAEVEVDRLRIKNDDYDKLDAEYDEQYAELEQLQIEVDRLRKENRAAVTLLADRDAIVWGWCPKEKKMGYYLDGNFAGGTLEEIITAKAAIAEVEEQRNGGDDERA